MFLETVIDLTWTPLPIKCAKLNLNCKRNTFVPGRISKSVSDLVLSNNLVINVQQYNKQLYNK